MNNRHSRHFSASQSQGFTLLEVVLVLFLMGLVASAGLMLTENVEDQAKYDETRQRMLMMRQAIIGNSTRTLNGRPEIGGFVADMKRLPGCVSELLSAEDCAGASLALWARDASTGVGAGWRGPYLYVSPESDGLRYFRDAYGNSDASDAINSGWDYQLSGEKIGLSSKGLDGVSGTGDDVSDAELIMAADWQINSIQIRFVNNSSTAKPAGDSNVKLRVILSNKDDKLDSHGVSLAAGAIPAESSLVKIFNFDVSNAVPLGSHGYLLLCSDGKVFDGGCTQAITYPADVRYFTVAPHANHTLDWVIP